jgi:large subunit ribosomal protein L18
MNRSKSKRIGRLRRHRRVRKRLAGTPDRPRLCVFRSNKHIYAQVVDDESGRTLLSVSTLSPELKGQLPKTGDVQAAARVGALVGRKCLEMGIKKVVFDRGGFRYHGRVKALAEAARKCFSEAGAEGF